MLGTRFPWYWQLGMGLFASEPRVVTVEQDDAATMADIHAASFHKGWPLDEFEAMIADRTVVGHVLRRRDNGPLIGFVLSRLAADEGEILTIALAPATRGRGWSARLLEVHLRDLRHRHVDKLFLEVESGNAAALALYKRHGFIEIGRRKGYYRTACGRADAIMMTRML